MKINELFLKPIDREIEGVIKADDEAHLRTEVEEYVITNEIARNLSNLLTEYNKTRPSNNGVWISGFFGSGKSHLLKILALLLENRRWDGFSIADVLHDKLPTSDAMLRAEIRKVTQIPAKSILFNIDQKAPIVNADEFNAVLSVFSRVFDEFCGYYGNQGYVANFERELDHQGCYQSFKDHYFQLTGTSWHEAREVFNINRQKIAQAFASTTGNSEASSRDIIQSYRDDYKPSIDAFAKNVRDYIQTQEQGFRLNFFVDEVGQYIAENVKLMTNLQTIAETLATACNGQSWLFVTSQDDMSKVFGELSQRLGNDFSKIQARFQTKIHLRSQDVAEVIQKRLLKKNEVGEAAIKALYTDQHQNFGTLFSFPDGGTAYQLYRDESEFVASYPYVPYQYSLFQQCIETLSAHNAFTGKHNSVGERSMLGVFQDVIKAISQDPSGSLGSFDLMFEGIRSAFKASIQSSITMAENNLGNVFAVKVLKALFLVKYVKGFKATPRNLRVLMQSRFNEDIQALEKKIREALALLEQQTYIQRNEEVYEYLTDEEQDVENEIKNTNLENEDVYKVLDEIFFSEIIRDSKIRYEANQQDYPFARRIDGRQRGKDHELAIDIISPYHEFSGNSSILKAHSLDKPDLLVVLPQDSQFLQDVTMAIRTESYIKQHHALNNPEAINAILAGKAAQNNARKKSLSQKASQLVADAVFITSGEEAQVNGEDAKSRIVKAFNLLIEKIYPHLRMLGKQTYSENDIRSYLEPQEGALFEIESLGMNEAETELFTYISNNKQSAIRTSMKMLEDHFEKRPYGWYLAAIQCVVAQLVGRGKLEPWQAGNLLENGPLERALKNTYNFNTLFLDPVQTVDPRIISFLKDFHQDFFDEPTSETDARRLVRSLQDKATALQGILSSHYLLKERYPFLNRLAAVIQQLDDFARQDYAYFTSALVDQKEGLLDLKEAEINPVLTFMAGPKRAIYDELVDFVYQKKPDLSASEIETLRTYLEDPRIFADNRLQQAKAELTRLDADLRQKLEEQRQRALSQVSRLREQMQQMADFELLNPAQREELNVGFAQITETLKTQELSVSIRDKVYAFERGQYPGILTRLHELAAPTSPGPEVQGPEAPRVTFVHIRDVRVELPKSILENEADVAAYCDAIQAALLEAVRANKRINL